MSTLYELQSNYRDLQDMLENEEYDTQAIIDTLESIEGEIDIKIDNIACLIKEMSYESESFASEIKKLQERKQAKENKINSLTDYVYSAMLNTGKAKIETARNKISIRNNPPKVVVNNLEMLKQLEFAWKKKELTESDVDKTELKKRLSSGEIIEGVNLESSQSLSIK